MPSRKSPVSNTRGLLNHGAGKGDKDRTTDHASYVANFPEGVGPKERLPGGKFRKVYGPVQPPSVFVNKIIIH